MPEWSKTIDLHLDVNNMLSPVVQITSGKARPPSIGLAWKQGDDRPMRLFFGARDPDTSEWTPLDLESGDTLTLIAKPSEDLSGDTLFSCTSWASGVSGSDTYYQGQVDFNTVLIIS